MAYLYAPRLEITTRIGCSVNCFFCPQASLIKRYSEFGGDNKKLLSFKDFCHCIDKLPSDTRIDFSGMCEPWLNPECTKMVLYAHEKGFRIAVYTTMLGMTENDFTSISDIPFEQFVLHIPDDKGNTNIKITAEYISLLKLAANAKREGENVVSAYSCHANVHPLLSGIIPEGSRFITELQDRAGNVSESSGDSVIAKKQSKGEVLCVNCSDRFDHNVLLPNGLVLLCCMDYGMEHILGNLLTQEWDDIHKSDEMQKIRDGRRDENSGILCRNCTSARNITEIYEDYALYNDWAGNLERTIANQNITIADQNVTIAKQNEYISQVKNVLPVKLFAKLKRLD